MKQLYLCTCNSGSKWPLAIRKNSVPQRGVEPRPLANRASVITTRWPRTHWSLSHSPLQGESSPHAFRAWRSHWPQNVTGEQPLKLAHSLMGYALGMTVNNGLDDQSLGSRHTEINFNQIYFPRKQLKIHYHFLTICLWLNFKLNYKNEIYFTGNSQKQKLSFII